MTESKEFGSAGQSDGIFLIAQDTVPHSLKILMDPQGYHDRDSDYRMKTVLRTQRSPSLRSLMHMEMAVRAAVRIPCSPWKNC